MNHLNEINDNINELILNKSFDRLTEEEKVKALEYAGSEEEYNNLRQTLMAITSSFNEEAEEDFAADDVKTDLMSQFEKKFGSSGNRTKVVPLYRKPYFQLAVAASLALLIFLTIPIFKDNGSATHGELATLEATGKKQEADGKDKAPGDMMGLNANKPDVGTGVNPQEPMVTEKGSVNAEKEKVDDKPAQVVAAVSDMEQKEKEAPLLKEEYSSVMKKAAEKAERKQDLSDEVSRDDQLTYFKDEAKNEKTLEAQQLNQDISSNTKTNRRELKEVEESKVAVSESKKDGDVDLSAKKGKEKATATTYTHHTGDHTHDHLDRMNSIAASGTTGPSRNVTTSVVGFVEQNKNEMMDLLFTVY